jgi:tetraacyldisaccharide 4'-kinase
MRIPRPVAILLSPVSLVYAAVARMRAWVYARGWTAQKRLGRPVISVGNLTVGGTGKTPMVIWLAEKFLEEGRRVAILSRGYRGANGTSDEIELMKRRLGERVLFGAGKDRYAEGRRLETAGAEMFLLDDGFQHLPLARDVDILLIDTSRDFKGELVLPAGSLREPLSALERSDLIVYTRVNGSLKTSAMVKQLRGAQKYPLFTCETKLLGFRPGRDALLVAREAIGDGPFFAFCGIGNPDGFFSDLRKWQIPVVGSRAFRDHHRYATSDLSALRTAATKAGARGLITTEKDLQNISDDRALAMPLFAGVIDIDVQSPEELMAAIREKIGRRTAA